MIPPTQTLPHRGEGEKVCGSDMAALRACRVVLVRPRIAANIGATARVMRNLGFEQLVLVAPAAEPDDPRGLLLATHAEDILRQAKIVPNLGDAVADCLLVAG